MTSHVILESVDQEDIFSSLRENELPYCTFCRDLLLDDTVLRWHDGADLYLVCSKCLQEIPLCK
jgi:hypothetical protein